MEQYECTKCLALNTNKDKCISCGSLQLKLYAYDESAEIESRQKLNECYHSINQILKDYLDTSEDNYKIMSIWIIGTYFHKGFYSYPYLFFNAMRGSGKTRGLKLISNLGAKGDGSVQNNLTEAVLFRIEQGTTTCIDEVEQIGSKEKQTLRELLNSAYKKGMKVKRMRKGRDEKGGEKQIVEVFEPYFPICMANIWGMDEVLGDRSITLILEKSSNEAITKMIEDFDINPKIDEVKRTLKQISDVCDVTLRKKNIYQRWNNYIRSKYITSLTSYTYITTQTTLTAQDIEFDELFNKIDKLGIAGRNLELFLPLLIVAEEVGVLDELLEVCGKLSSAKKNEEYNLSKDVNVYEFVITQENEGLNYLAIKDLTRMFRQFLGEEDNDDRWLNEKWFGRALKRLNLIIGNKKTNRGNQVVLNYNKAREKLKIFKEKE